MRIEFYRAGRPDEVLGAAEWTSSGHLIHADDDEGRSALSHLFRPTPVATDDASYRRQGTHGEALLQPGSLRWFRAAAFARAGEAGLIARLIPGVTEGGWDPAAQYRTFPESIELLERGS